VKHQYDEPAGDLFDEVIHDTLLFLRGSALAKRLGYAKVRVFWGRVERLERAGKLVTVRWDRNNKCVTECWLCEWSAIRIAELTRGPAVDRVKRELVHFSINRRLEECRQDVALLRRQRDEHDQAQRETRL